MNCAENSYDDRLHRCEVNVHTERIRQLAETKTVVTAMKTVVMEIRCRNPGKEPCLLCHISVFLLLFTQIFDSSGV